MDTPSWKSTWLAQRKSSRSELRKSLKRLKRIKPAVLNKAANETHEEVFSKVDCLECANCCTSIPPIVTDTDTRRISKALGLKPNQFRDQYLRQDEDGDTVIEVNLHPSAVRGGGGPSLGARLQATFASLRSGGGPGDG